MERQKAVLGEPSPTFESSTLYGRELVASEIPMLQALFDANPEYFLAVNGRSPHPNEAQTEFEEMPPAHFAFTRRWFLGLFDRSHKLVGVAIVLSDLVISDAWHIGLFLLATDLHGTGAASDIYLALETWTERSGARWLRLGVVEGNLRAERFWSRHGFREVRVRRGVDTGGRVNDVRVLVKPLGAGSVAEYLERVPRDQPGSQLQ